MRTRMLLVLPQPLSGASVPPRPPRTSRAASATPGAASARSWLLPLAMQGRGPPLTLLAAGGVADPRCAAPPRKPWVAWVCGRRPQLRSPCSPVEIQQALGSCLGPRAAAACGGASTATVALAARARSDGAADVRWACVRALTALGPEVASRFSGDISACLEDSAWSVRRAAVQALASLGPLSGASHAASVAERLRRDARAEMRLAAAEALRELGPASPLAAVSSGEALAAAAREDPSEAVRAAAAQALLALCPAGPAVAPGGRESSPKEPMAGGQNRQAGAADGGNGGDDDDDDWGTGDLSEDLLPM
mmetsp:Transcript_123162/g.393731  ORF Transcript_123162/g.393731 Transcript_123162/m.393731 type:complete len:308 (+) Transcript_123162:273-1196(+)